MSEAVAHIVVGGVFFLIYDSNPSFAYTYKFLETRDADPCARRISVGIKDWKTNTSPGSSSVSVRYEADSINIHKDNCFNAIFVSAENSVDLHVSTLLQSADAYSRAIVVSSVVRILAAELLRRDGGMLFHASSVVSERNAHLFAGVSGTGKSTICALSKNREILADEISICIPENGVFRLDPSPFVSDRALPFRSSGSYPLKSINLLQQSDVNERIQISPRDAIVPLMKHLLHFSDESAEHALALDNTIRLLESTPVFLMKFTLSSDFWKLIDAS